MISLRCTIEDTAQDDDALDVFKKAVPAAAMVQTVGFLQAKHGKASKMQKALTSQVEGAQHTLETGERAIDLQVAVVWSVELHDAALGECSIALRVKEAEVGGGAARGLCAVWEALRVLPEPAPQALP